MIFVVEMLRNDSREEHSYIDGVYDDEVLAIKAALEHMKCRGGKYGAEVHGYQINGGERDYYRKLSCDIAFAESLLETAANIRKMLETTGAQDAADGDGK
jgi:hypothetical protein